MGCGTKALTDRATDQHAGSARRHRGTSDQGSTHTASSERSRIHAARSLASPGQDRIRGVRLPDGEHPPGNQRQRLPDGMLPRNSFNRQVPDAPGAFVPACSCVKATWRKPAFRKEVKQFMVASRRTAWIDVSQDWGSITSTGATRARAGPDCAVERH